jgi:hypothetical protein
MNALQEAIHYCIIKFCIYCFFFFWYKFFVHYTLRVEWIINMILTRDFWNSSFFSRGDVSPTHSELCCFVSESQAKHQVTSPVIILLKKLLSALAIAIMSCQDVTRSSLCSAVKECGTKCAHNLLFPNPLSESKELQSWGCSKILLSFLMRFDCHFLINQQQQQCLPQFELMMDGHHSCHHLPAPFHLEIENTI